jgi:hypothetical protein
MTGYVIAIPSFRRAETLRDKTLKTLSDYGIPNEDILIFVTDEQDYSRYRDVLPGYEIIKGGAPKLVGARRFIKETIRNGENILNMDDDVSAILKRVDDKTTVPLEDLDAFIRRAFALCRVHGTGLWGVYPITNPYFMKDTVTTDLRHIVGAFFGEVNSSDPSLFTSITHKEDYERSILYYIRFGKVIRMNNVGVKTAYYTQPGGMQEYRNEQAEIDGGTYLLKKYPKFVQFNKNPKKKYFEIKLKDSRSK